MDKSQAKAASKKVNVKELKVVGPDQEEKKYDLSTEERAVWGMISAQFELADEKVKSAGEIRKTSNLLKDHWVKSLVSQRSIDPTRRINVDVEKGVLTVAGKE